MDSRIREALTSSHEFILCVNELGLEPDATKDAFSDMVDKMSKALALLTAEPEPCEDARNIAEYAQDRITHDGGDIFLNCVNDVAMKIESYAFQVADKRAEELREQVETLREFVADAVQWSEAYPEHIFTPPTPEQVDAVCKTLGFRIDRIAAMVLREFTGRWSNKARALLSATEPKP